jgi:hypothetical protein
MTRDEADKTQDWASLPGRVAFHLIERHADDWDDAHELMEAWARAKVKAEREACARLVERRTYLARASLSSALSDEAVTPCHIAAEIRARGAA